jgi:formylglycine-generating enzyme required for sulfatase activity
MKYFRIFATSTVLLWIASCADVPPDPTVSATVDTFRDCESCPDVVIVPAGSFQMGSPLSEAGQDYDDERPIHRVIIQKQFAMATHEITRGDFAKFVNETGYDPVEGCSFFGPDGWEHDPKLSWRDPKYRQTDSHPVVCVSWADANAFADWLSRKTSKRYRLPTEAEWEYAARAGSSTARFWGDDADRACPYANTGDLTWKKKTGHKIVANCRDGYHRTAPVASFHTNQFGLHDMLGNVLEWTEDCWHINYDKAPTDGSAWTDSGDCNKRVLRGGSFDVRPSGARSARRYWGEANSGDNLSGFRIVRELD